MAAGPTNEITEFNELGWYRWPARVGRLSPGLGDVVADGDYLAAWPTIGAAVLPATLILGFLLGAAHFGYAPAEAIVYLYALPALIVLILLGQHGAGVGFAGWFSYILGDLVHTYLSPGHGGKLQAVLASEALSAALLWILLVAIPRATRLFSKSFAPTAAGTRPRLLRATACHAALQVLFVYLWFRMAPLLLQAASAWRDVSPDTDNLAAWARTTGWAPAIVAAYAGAMRVLFETSAQASGAVRDRRQRRLAAFAAVNAKSGALRALAGAVLEAAFLTFLLSSLLGTPAVAGVVFAAFFAATALRRVALGHMGFGRSIRRVSPCIRLALAAGLIVAASFVVAKLFGQTGGLTPLLGLIVGSVALCALLFPPAAPRPAHASPTA